MFAGKSRHTAYWIMHGLRWRNMHYHTSYRRNFLQLRLEYGTHHALKRPEHLRISSSLWRMSARLLFARHLSGSAPNEHHKYPFPFSRLLVSSLPCIFRSPMSMTVDDIVNHKLLEGSPNTFSGGNDDLTGSNQVDHENSYGN